MPLAVGPRDAKPCAGLDATAGDFKLERSLLAIALVERGPRGLGQRPAPRIDALPRRLRRAATARVFRRRDLGLAEQGVRRNGQLIAFVASSPRPATAHFSVTCDPAVRQQPATCVAHFQRRCGSRLELHVVRNSRRATLRGDQAMSALFGHIKGAFTGATIARPGLLKAADQGLLFLDEIGELGLDEQAMLLRAVEDKRFLPVGADREAHSDFQLIVGTNRDLQWEVGRGAFREDLLARINLWTFRLPGLAERHEDIAPNLDYELERHSSQTGHKVTMNKEARHRFLTFAQSPEAAWSANFRDLGAAVTRMATLATSGRITLDDVNEETARLTASWRRSTVAPPDVLSELLTAEQLAKLDLFDRVQLTEVVRICRASESLSAVGRTLFAASRASKSQPNDADRLRKYLTRFGLTWAELHRE